MDRALPRPLVIPSLDPGWSAFAVLAIMSGALVLWMGQGLTFASDECAFLGRSLSAPLAPHNEHWSTVPLLLWKGVQAAFGAGSYLPFLALLVVVNIALSAVLYAAIGGLVGLAAASLMLLLGSASDNVFMAFQIGFGVSITAGTVALLMVERRRYGLATLALLVALASSGMGLPFLAAAIIMAVGYRDRAGWFLLAPVAVYGAWFLAFGRGAVTQANPLENVARVPALVGRWMLEGFGAVSGFPGVLVVVVLIGSAAWMMYRGWRPSPLIVGSAAGIVALFAIIALVRDGDLVSRYITPFAVFAVLIVGRMPWPRHRYLVAGAFIVLAWALTVNVAGLIRHEYEFAYFLELGYGCDQLGR